MVFLKRLRLAILLAGLLRGQSANISGYIFDQSGRGSQDILRRCGYRDSGRRKFSLLRRDSMRGNHCAEGVCSADRRAVRQ